MHGFAAVIAILPFAALAVWAEARINVPYPVLLVSAGLLFGAAHLVRGPDLSPDLVFVVFLPPLLYYAGYFVSPVDLRANAGQIGLLAVGLVIVTMVAVAAALVVLVPELPVAAAAVAGAVVAPTDPVAATSVFRRSGAPERLVTIVEGEGLVNDGAALVFYGSAVAATVAGSVRAGSVAWDLLAAPAGGVVIGLAVAWVSVAIRRRLDEPLVEITISLATPYLTYLLAEFIGLSGILATVAAGFYVGSRTGLIYAARSRLQAYAFLDVLVFLLNAVLFALVGMELARVVHDVPGVSVPRVVVIAATVVAVVVGIRLVWMLIGPSAVQARLLGPAMTWHERTVVGWSGMRGGVSLAAALALPLTLDDGSPFPARALILVIAAAVIVTTLVMQGTTLPPLLRWLGVGHEDQADQERQARLLTTRAALDWLEDRAAAGVADEAVAPLRTLYSSRLSRLEQSSGGEDNEAEVYATLRLEMLAAERAALMALHDEGRISASVLRRIEHGLDLEESRVRRR